ncbi:MAG: YHYH protein [Bacteroidetes bacterium]|nr:YHYH protein [Bacteroidota bacterium]
MRSLILLFSLFLSYCSFSQLNPAITHWLINMNGQTGFAGIPTNVQQVQYSANNVYVSTTDVPDWIPLGYNWPNNPWSPQNQNFVFKITLNPSEKIMNKIATAFGHIGIWTNGVSIYNQKDAKSWNDSSVWWQNALFFEHLDMETMDTCLGHPNDKFEYHLHVHPKCLWNETDSSTHAPLLGFAFDGFPIYGCYGFTNANGTGPIKKLKSSYRLRNIAGRTVLPNGVVLNPVYYGPTLAQYPLGAYIEDYEFVNGLGDLDSLNGRFSVTPEYPNGIYCYFVTLDDTLGPAFPYVLGPRYFGMVQPGNTGPNSGHNTISEPVLIYTSVNDIDNEIIFKVYPNPTSTTLNLFLIPSFFANMSATLVNTTGRTVMNWENIQTAVNYQYDISHLPKGLYILQVNGNGKTVHSKIIIK